MCNFRGEMMAYATAPVPVKTLAEKIADINNAALIRRQDALSYYMAYRKAVKAACAKSDDSAAEPRK